MIGNINNWVELSDPLSLVTCWAALLVIATGAFWLIGVVRWASRPKSIAQQYPTVSVIIAARNEAKLIRNCLESLLNQTYPAHLLNICLIDDHSTDNTLAVAQGLSTLHPERLQVLSAPPCPTGIGPKKSALQFGISQTAGDVLLFTDADCVVPPRWVETMLQHLGPETGAVTGAMLPPKHRDAGGRLFRLERLSVSLITASAIGWGSPASATGGNFAYRRKTFTELGGFAHPELPSGDDDLMAQAIAARGWRVDFARGQDSVVTDFRSPTVKQVASASARHQSTTRYYPFRWRFAYAFSVASGAAAILCFVVLWMRIALWPVVATCFVLRAASDLAMLSLFTRQIGDHADLMDFLMAEFLLPLYSVFRPLMKLMPKFAWRGRVHASLARASGQAVT